MSDLPPPYSPPPYQPSPYYGYGQTPPPDLLQPARWAGGLMFAIAAIFLLLGTCAGLLLFLPLEQLPPEQQQLFREYEAKTQQSFKTTVLVSSIVTLVIGVMIIVFGIFVRKGGRGWIIASLIGTGLLVVYMLLNIASAAMIGGAKSLAMPLCFMSIPIALIIMLLVQLTRALRNSRNVQEQSDYAQQWWQYQQQQMYYAQQQQQQPNQPPFQPPPPPPQT